MKVVGKLFAIVVVGVVIMCNVGTVLAAGYSIGLSPVPPKINDNIISVYGLNPPDISNLYSNGTQSTVRGSSMGYPLYTEKAFYGADEITYSIVNEDSVTLTITLYSYDTKLKRFVPTFSSQEIAKASKGSGSFKNLNPEKYYCLKFDGGSLDFHGFVGGKTN